MAEFSTNSHDIFESRRRFISNWEHIISKYDRDFPDSDVVDLHCGLVVDKGHLADPKFNSISIGKAPLKETIRDARRHGGEESFANTMVSGMASGYAASMALTRDELINTVMEIEKTVIDDDSDGETIDSDSSDDVTDDSGDVIEDSGDVIEDSGNVVAGSGTYVDAGVVVSSPSHDFGQRKPSERRAVAMGTPRDVAKEKRVAMGQPLQNNRQIPMSRHLISSEDQSYRKPVAIATRGVAMVSRENERQPLRRVALKKSKPRRMESEEVGTCVRNAAAMENNRIERQDRPVAVNNKDWRPVAMDKRHSDQDPGFVAMDNRDSRPVATDDLHLDRDRRPVAMENRHFDRLRRPVAMDHRCSEQAPGPMRPVLVSPSRREHANAEPRRQKDDMIYMDEQYNRETNLSDPVAMETRYYSVKPILKSPHQEIISSNGHHHRKTSSPVDRTRNRRVATEPVVAMENDYHDYVDAYEELPSPRRNERTERMYRAPNRRPRDDGLAPVAMEVRNHGYHTDVRGRSQYTSDERERFVENPRRIEVSPSNNRHRVDMDMERPVAMVRRDSPMTGREYLMSPPQRASPSDARKIQHSPRCHGDMMDLERCDPSVRNSPRCHGDMIDSGEYDGVTMAISGRQGQRFVSPPRHRPAQHQYAQQRTPVAIEKQQHIAMERLQPVTMETRPTVAIATVEGPRSVPRRRREPMRIFSPRALQLADPGAPKSDVIHSEQSFLSLTDKDQMSSTTNDVISYQRPLPNMTSSPNKARQRKKFRSVENQMDVNLERGLDEVDHSVLTRFEQPRQAPAQRREDEYLEELRYSTKPTEVYSRPISRESQGNVDRERDSERERYERLRRERRTIDDHRGRHHYRRPREETRSRRIPDNSHDRNVQDMRNSAENRPSGSRTERSNPRKPEPRDDRMDYDRQEFSPRVENKHVSFNDDVSEHSEEIRSVSDDLDPPFDANQRVSEGSDISSGLLEFRSPKFSSTKTAENQFEEFRTFPNRTDIRSQNLNSSVSDNDSVLLIQADSDSDRDFETLRSSSESSVVAEGNISQSTVDSMKLMKNLASKQQSYPNDLVKIVEKCEKLDNDPVEAELARMFADAERQMASKAVMMSPTSKVCSWLDKIESPECEDVVESNFDEMVHSPSGMMAKLTLKSRDSPARNRRIRNSPLSGKHALRLKDSPNRSRDIDRMDAEESSGRSPTRNRVLGNGANRTTTNDKYNNNQVDYYLRCPPPRTLTTPRDKNNNIQSGNFKSPFSRTQELRPKSSFESRPYQSCRPLVLPMDSDLPPRPNSTTPEKPRALKLVRAETQIQDPKTPNKLDQSCLDEIETPRRSKKRIEETFSKLPPLVTSTPRRTKQTSTKTPVLSPISRKRRGASPETLTAKKALTEQHYDSDWTVKKVPRVATPKRKSAKVIPKVRVQPMRTVSISKKDSDSGSNVSICGGPDMCNKSFCFACASYAKV